ncbi:MAG: catechol 2,3-dioxygenase [Thermoplasmata archaeon]|jgi:catechol 2,3-dioxygenase|nr:catechol 2,3-dioxygenase [Thermoplasmata archaeon]
MKAHELGHAVFYVRDLQASLRFYRDTLGFQVVGDAFGGKAAALVGNNRRTHHELLLIEVGDAPGNPPGRRRGLYHIGIKVGDSKEELRAAVDELRKAGVAIDGSSDHTVSWSLYLTDPDGNEVELYCDNPAIDWKKDPSSVMAPIRRLQI